jgi:dethiobiotin synthetase
MPIKPIKLFITGTDTHVGKTYVSVGLLKAFNQHGLSTLGLKPVASGCIVRNNQLYSEDALALQASSSIKLDYRQINPFAFEPPIAPHIAAKQIHHELNLQTLNHHTQSILSSPADVCLIEGVGGWYVPLNNRETMADFVFQHHLMVILVIGIRLGCINHGILTFKAIEREGAPIVGWIANCIQPEMLYCQENIVTLCDWLPIPFLGTVKYQDHPENEIDISHIIPKAFHF